MTTQRHSLHERFRKKGTPSPSAEHYLRAIFQTSRDGGARVTDLADTLGVTKATVTITSRSLIEQGFLIKGSDRRLYLTDEGRRIAQRVCARHSLLHSFLEDVLGLPREVVETEICRIEHVISDMTADRLIDLVKFYNENGDKLPGVKQDFADYHRSSGTRSLSEACSRPCDNLDCEFHPDHKMPES